MKKRAKKYFVLVLLLLTVAVLYASVSRGGSFDYSSYGRRDPFVPLVGVSGVSASGGLSGIVSIDDVLLQGIVIGSDGKGTAIINGEMFKEGFTDEGVSLISVGQSSIKIKINEDVYTVELYR